MDEKDDPTPLELLVSQLNHSGKSQYVGMLFPVPTRLKADSYGMLEALTHHAGISRNKMVNQLLDVGIAATLESLPEDLVQSLIASSGDVMRASLDKNGGTWERGDE